VIFEYAGFGYTLYSLARNLVGSLDWVEESKVVDDAWLGASGLRDHWENQGFKLRWARPERVEYYKTQEYEEALQIDKEARVKCRLINASEGLLMLKPEKD